MMKHIVIVRMEDMDNVILRAIEIREWMKASFPDMQESSDRMEDDWFMQYGGGHGPAGHLQVSFKDVDKAALFKLAWGG